MKVTLDMLVSNMDFLRKLDNQIFSSLVKDEKPKVVVIKKPVRFKNPTQPNRG